MNAADGRSIQHSQQGLQASMTVTCRTLVGLSVHKERTLRCGLSVHQERTLHWGLSVHKERSLHCKGGKQHVTSSCLVLHSYIYGTSASYKSVKLLAYSIPPWSYQGAVVAPSHANLQRHLLGQTSCATRIAEIVICRRLPY